MDVVAYLRILRRHWRMVVVAAVLGGLIGAGTTVLDSTSATGGSGGRYYKATHTLFLDTSSSGTSYRPLFTNLDQMAVLTTTGDVPQKVGAAVGGDPHELATHIFISTNGTLSTIDITAAERDPQAAVKLADTFAQALMDSIKAKEQTRIDQQRDDTLAQLNDLQNKIAAVDAQIATKPPDVSVLTAQRNSYVGNYSTLFEKFQGIANADDPTSNLSTLQAAEAQRISKSEYDARISAGQLGNNHVRADVFAQPQNDSAEPTGTTPSSTHLNGPFARGLLGALLGLLVGIGLALVAERIDRRIRSREEFEAAYGMPVLAEIPLLKASEQRGFELVAQSAPFSRSAEAYRAVRSSLLFQRPAQPGGQLSTRALTIMVASATPKEGKSTTTANLAAVFAESGQRVLVMNCDFRRPTLHRFFDVDNEPRRVLDSGIDGLMLVSDVTGAENSNPAHVTEQQRRIIINSQEHFEVLILDTSPLLSTNDATELMDLVDLAIVVGRVGQSTSDNTLRVRELLSRLDAPVAGVVMVGSDAATNDYYYYYSRGRAKELVKQDPAASKAKTRARTKPGANGNGTNGNGAAPRPAPTPEATEG